MTICVDAIICRVSSLHNFCHHCNTPTHKTVTVDYLRHHILLEGIKTLLLVSGDFQGLKNISQHPMRNVFYDGVCLGGNHHGINGMTQQNHSIYYNLGLSMPLKAFVSILDIHINLRASTQRL
jgi:hypothetical protein